MQGFGPLLNNCRSRGLPLRIVALSYFQAPRSTRPLNLQTLPRFRLDDFELGVPGPDLFLEPLAGVFFAVAEQDGARFDLANEVEQFIAVGVGGEVEAFQFA